MAKSQIRMAVVIFSGYLARWRPGLGLLDFHDRLAEAMPNRKSSFLGIYRWNSNTTELAERLIHFGADRLSVVGHSYGAGWAAIRLADELANFDRSIDQLFLLDPVLRRRILKPLTFTRLGNYPVPPNVRSVWAWRQVNRQGIFDPISMPIRCEGETKVRTLRCLGSRENLSRYATPDETACLAPEAKHTNVDDNRAIQRQIIRAIRP